MAKSLLVVSARSSYLAPLTNTFVNKFPVDKSVGFPERPGAYWENNTDMSCPDFYF
jgi:hypothetical protein